MSFFTSFARHYNRLLNSYKYPVQILSGGALWFSGDLISQNITKTKQEKINWERVGIMSLYGMGVSAPLFAFWYSYLDRVTNRLFARHAMSKPVTDTSLWKKLNPNHSTSGSTSTINCTANSGTPASHTIHSTANPISAATSIDKASSVSRTWKIIGFKMAADMFIFDPIYLSLFFVTTNVFEKKTFLQIKEKLKAELGTTFIADVIVWSPIQMLNFRFVPVLYQPLVVQSVNVGWNAFLSYVQHK